MSETENKPPPSVPIADVAHVVRNALVPADVALSVAREQSAAAENGVAMRKIDIATNAIQDVLSWVDGLVKRAHAEEP